MDKTIKPMLIINPTNDKIADIFEYSINVEKDAVNKYGCYNPITHEITTHIHNLLRKVLDIPEIENNILAFARTNTGDVNMIVFDAEPNGGVYHVEETGEDIQGILYE